MRTTRFVLMAVVVGLTLSKDARAQGSEARIDDKHEAQKRAEEPGAQTPARDEMEPASEPPKKEDSDDPDPKKFTFGASVETFYQWNFNRPGNGITNYRGFDNRHNTLTISTAVLDAGFRARDLLMRIAFQAGQTAAASYQQEPSLPGADGAAESNSQLWRHLQRASVGWQATTAWLFEAGLFLTNTGVESLAVKDNWNWSRTNAFTRLPSYQTGAKATYHPSERLDLIAGLFNGWNSVTDNNGEKTLLLQAQWKLQQRLSTSVAYFTGVERNRGAPEGRPWRHVFDGYFQLEAARWLQVAAEADAGWESTRFGRHWFAAAASYLRVRALEWLYFAVRLDRLWERPAESAAGTSEPFLIPARHVTSATATVDTHPTEGVSFRIEYRRDTAERELFFRGEVQGDGSTAQPYVPNARRQSTLLAGAVVWF